MKKVYKALALVAGLFVGTLAGQARHWTYNPDERLEAGNIQTGIFYALLPSAAASTGTYNFLAGERFSESQNLTDDNLYEFVSAESSDEHGNAIYYLRRKNGFYVAMPSNGLFYTDQLDRAWKIVVKQANYQDPNHTYARQETFGTGEEAKDSLVTYTGIDAYQWESRDNLDKETYNLSTLTFTDADGAVVLVDPTGVDPKDEYTRYNFFLTYAGTNSLGGPGKGSDYARNSWVIYPATMMEAKQGLEAVLQELFKGEDLAARLENYSKGDKAGEYDQAKYETLLQLWQDATAIVAGTKEASEEEVDRIAAALPGAYKAFVTSGKPLSAGYYIVYSMRPNGNIYPSGKPAYPYGRNGSPESYDDGAIYDGSAVNATDGNLRWSYLKTDAVNFSHHDIDSLGYRAQDAKFVWKVTDSGTKDNSGNPLYYFQNVETQKYIGKDPATYSPIVMTTKPEVAYTIAASMEFPGYFNFYSPALTKATEQGATQPAEYSGMHASSDVNNVVAWDWRVGGSCWKVRNVSEDEVKAMLEALAPAKRLATLENLVKQSETAIEAGKVYMGVDAQGNKIPHAASGELGAEVDGLVTTPEQLYCPMFDSAEGTNIGNLVDGNLTPHFHSTWHGGNEAWTKNHFLQMNFSQPEKDILIKWVKRDGTNNNGTPLKVVIWGSNSTDEAVLKAGKEEIPNEETGTPTMNFDAWKTKWDSLTVGTFSYPYEVTWTDGTTKKANAAGTGHFVLPENYQNIRIEVITRVADGDKPSGNKYFHAAEVRAYRAAYDKAASIYEAVPAEIKTALNNAVEAAKAQIKAGAASEAEVAALQKAYDDFIANYPDPAKVTRAIAAAKTLVNAAEAGDGLGYYETGAKEAATAVISSVEMQLADITATRQPSVEEVNKLLAELNAGLTTFASKLHVPTTGIYAVKSFSSNETVAGRRMIAKTSSRKDYVNMEGRKQENGKWADDPSVIEKLGAYWEVTKVDGGYTYKNLFTGLYLAPNKEDKGSRIVTQSETPYTFGLEFAKVAGAFNLVAKKEDVLNGEHVYVNAQPGGSFSVVFWNSASGRDNSAFQFEKVDAARLLEEGIVYNVPFPGKAQIMTFPIAIEKQDGFYSVIGQDAANNIQLKEVEGDLVAGQAYVYYPASAEENTVILYPVAKTLDALAPTCKEAAPANGLVATFEKVSGLVQFGIFNTDHTKVLLSEKTDNVAANTGYFTAMPVAESAGVKEIAANGKITSIDNIVVLDKAAQKGVYTISGIRVKNVNSLPAGLYIVNGQKVLVK